MKAKVILIYIVLISSILHHGLIYGQDSLRKSIPIKQLTLDGGSGEQTLQIPLRDSLISINFEIKATIVSGELTVELYDPYDEKYGYFSLAGSQSSVDKQNTDFVRGKTYLAEASGSLVRFVNQPPTGFWKAKIISKKALGVVQFNFTTTGPTILKKN